MQRNSALDILKLIMAIMVVGLHSSFLSETSQLGYHLTVQGIFRVAVPIFLLINGYYFYNSIVEKNITTWLKRVFILYCFWMFFYSFLWLDLTDFSIRNIARSILYITMGWYHLWYLSGMIFTALILILMKRFSDFTLIISIIISFLTGVLIQYLGNYHYFEGNVVDRILNLNFSHRNAVFFCYPFFCIGYLIHKNHYDKLINLKNAIGFSIIGLILLFIESYINFLFSEKNQGMDNLLSLIIACTFIFVCSLKVNFSKNTKMIALFSSAIYFLHVFFVEGIKNTYGLEGTYLTIAAIIGSLLASFILIKINKKAKYLL